MASKKVQDFIGRNVGKWVEVSLSNGRTFSGKLERHESGYTIHSGNRGRPPVFAMEDVKTCKRADNPEPQAQRATRTQPEPQITQPVNTSKESYPQPQVRRAATKQERRRPTPEELAKAQAIADEAQSATE